jgi:hypothetical protein
MPQCPNAGLVTQPAVARALPAFHRRFLAEEAARWRPPVDKT